MVCIPFVKYSGCGNDFILIDNREKIFNNTDPSFISSLTERRTGIGADGIILLENSSIASFKMRIFNADGSEAEMCGNGIRCLVKFINELGIKDTHLTIETMHRILKVSLEGEDVTVQMGDPEDLKKDVCLKLGNQTLSMDYMDTGVPHAVLFVDAIDQVDLAFLGPKVRYHPAFAPRGTNVNVAEVCSNGSIRVRTYERGVEGETLACGTGAAATALAASLKFGLKSPISVIVRSQETLKIGFVEKEGSLSQIAMTGPARRIFSGIF